MSSDEVLLGEILGVLRGTRRIHFALENMGIRDAARLLVSGLLLSHGIRRDTAVLVRVSGRLLVAPGSTLRHLRPDLESATGWVRAVLFKGKARVLGAFVIEDEWIGDDFIVERYAEAGSTLLTCPGEPAAARISIREPVIVTHETESMDDGECLVRAPCGLACRAAISNIVLDRVLAGLPA